MRKYESLWIFLAKSWWTSNEKFLHSWPNYSTISVIMLWKYIFHEDQVCSPVSITLAHVQMWWISCVYLWQTACDELSFNNEICHRIKLCSKNVYEMMSGAAIAVQHTIANLNSTFIKSTNYYDLNASRINCENVKESKTFRLDIRANEWQSY